MVIKVQKISVVAVNKTNGMSNIVDGSHIKSIKSMAYFKSVLDFL